MEMKKCSFNCGDTELDKLTCQCYNDYLQATAMNNNNSILIQFNVIEESIKRAKLPYEVNMPIQPHIKEVTLYELIKSYHQIENLIREIGEDRFDKKVKEIRRLITPEIRLEDLNVCPYCGDPSCTSDHK